MNLRGSVIVSGRNLIGGHRDSPMKEWRLRVLAGLHEFTS